MPRLPVDAARYAMYSSAMGAAEEEKPRRNGRTPDTTLSATWLNAKPIPEILAKLPLKAQKDASFSEEVAFTFPGGRRWEGRQTGGQFFPSGLPRWPVCVQRPPCRKKLESSQIAHVYTRPNATTANPPDAGAKAHGCVQSKHH